MTASIKPKGCEGGGGFHTAYATIRRFDTHHQAAACARKSEPLRRFTGLPRLFSALVIAFTLLVLLAVPTTKVNSADQQKDPQKEQKEPPKDQPKDQPKKDQPKGVFTAEQISEGVIIAYGSRPALEQIRRNGVERGRVTRNMPEGATEESNYERRFVRGENLDKDKIRLDQRLPTMEYSLVYGGGKIWGLINGTAFTPREDTAASFLSQHHHSLDSLLRYKENGSTITLAGQEKQKGLDLYIIDVEDKEKRKTRFFISTKTLRVLWLEYEEAPVRGATPVKYTKKFMDYRVVQQTLVPYRTVLLEDGRETQETRLLTVTYGSKVDDSIFKNPEA